MAAEESLMPGQTREVASGMYNWTGDGKPLPITETWSVSQARTGYVLESTADATAVPDFGYAYTATLSVNDELRATGLAMKATRNGHTVRVNAHFETDAAVITRVLVSAAEGAIQRTQTFRMPPGYTVEAHPALFDGLHIAAMQVDTTEPHRRPCLWFDLTARDPGNLMAAHPVTYAIGVRPGPIRNRYAMTRWGYDLRVADTLITVQEVAGWLVPRELRFTLAGTVYAVKVALT